jgi:hypothetical protein
MREPPTKLMIATYRFLVNGRNPLTPRHVHLWFFLARVSDSFQPDEVAQKEFDDGYLPFPKASPVIRRRRGYGGQGPDRERILGEEDGGEHRS